MPNAQTSTAPPAFSWLEWLLGRPAARPSAAASAGERRSSKRREVSIEARLVPEFGRSFPCTIVDLSLAGARVRFAGEAPSRLSTVRLVFLPSRRMHLARVRWSQDTDMGLEFVG